MAAQGGLESFDDQRPPSIAHCGKARAAPARRRGKIPVCVRWASQRQSFFTALSIWPVLIGTVYDPTFGDDSRNFLGMDARIARANFNRVNATIARLAASHGQLVDLHRHFLGGDPSWFTRTIEPSLRGASEVRAAFLPVVLSARG